MLSAIAKQIFGSANDRLVKRYGRDIERINALEPEIQKLSDDELRAKTEEFRDRLKNGETLDKILHEAFAVVREASVRTLGLRHFDVQLIGGIVQHNGMISEMKTGEGKTLVATLSAYINAIEGKGVHVVTVNDYLAERDAAWMGKVYSFLGLKVGVIKNSLDDFERIEAYNADITYATNNELGFDYLRDNMKYHRSEMVQRPFNFAIVDEVDSILIDEARTPLIISGPTDDNSALYSQIDKIIPQIQDDHVEIDEKSKSVTLNEEGIEHAETLLREAGLIEGEASLYDIDNVSIVHHLNQALRAHKMFTKDVDYIVKDRKVIIIDEFTGRMMEGRRYSDGLHQALEAKENAEIQNENQTLASITFQNYFRLYPKLAGMTGTAMTEAAEFNDIYKLDVVEIPTNVPVIREDHDDLIFRTSAERDNAVIELIKECHARKQPVLVGTVSIEKSESFSKQLKKAKIPHNVLNARHHEQEAHIIAQAGCPGAVTIATNMAGRGTDIQLGGNVDMLYQARHPVSGKAAAQDLKTQKDSAQSSNADSQNDVLMEKIKKDVERDKEIVKQAGGLYVIATERHESRRIDNQLRGRSGRQGDAGASSFFISLEDDLMRIFGSERIDGMLQKLGMEEGESINHPWMNKAIERAQGKVEQRNYEIRKSLLKFDDVMNDQRKAIYEQRIELMNAEHVSDIIDEMRDDVNEEMVSRHIPPKSYSEQWDTEGLEKEIFHIYGLELDITKWASEEGIADEEILDRITKATDELMDAKRAEYDERLFKAAEQRMLLQTLDQQWKDHLLSLDHLRQGIGLRAHGQRDPLNEYKQEAFTLFESLLHELRAGVTTRMARIKIHVEDPEEIMQMQQQRMQESRVDPALADAMPQEIMRSRINPEDRDPNDPSTWGKVGRNELCPCGSGKKFKQCHGAIV